MAAEDFPSPANEKREAEARDPWGELLDRLGSAPAEQEQAGPAPQGDDRPGRSEARAPAVSDSHSRSERAPPRLWVWLAAAALLILAVVLARALLPAAPEGDPAGPSHPAPVGRPMRSAIRRVGKAPEAPSHRPRPGKGRRGRHERHGGGERIRRHRVPSRPRPHGVGPRPEPEPQVPTPVPPPAPSAPPSEAPPPAPPAPEASLGTGEPAPPGTGQPGGGGHLEDGSHSPEFGL